MSDISKPDDEMPRSPHHLLDELKNVLSNLGQPAESAPVVDPEVEPQPPENISFSPSSPRFSTDQSPSSPASSAAAAAPPASDADFWNGNVLGWPSGAETVKREPVPEPMLSPAVSTPQPPPPPPSPPPPSAPVSVTPPSVPVDRPPWPLDDVVPEPPSAPKSPEKLDFDIGAPTFAESEISVGESEPNNDRPGDAFPIPRTIEEAKPAPETTDNPLLQTDLAPKPKGLVQLACFFPEGNDKVGQQFAKQLKTIGSQRTPALVIEPVLISSWSSSNVDVSAWTKSAQLSGADIMFILAPHQDMQLFQKNSVIGIRPAITTRVVATEHVSLRTLYADIMIELTRRL